MAVKRKPTLCLDFDGVIHRYDSAWTDAVTIEDDATQGLFEWLAVAVRHFRIVIYSSRSGDPQARNAMRHWLRRQHKAWRKATGREIRDLDRLVSFADRKPAAFLTIDDRAICFDGDWSTLDPLQLLTFKPWNKRGAANG